MYKLKWKKKLGMNACQNCDIKNQSNLPGKAIRKQSKNFYLQSMTIQTHEGVTIDKDIDHHI